MTNHKRETIVSLFHCVPYIFPFFSVFFPGLFSFLITDQEMAGYAMNTGRVHIFYSVIMKRLTFFPEQIYLKLLVIIVTWQCKICSSFSCKSPAETPTTDQLEGLSKAVVIKKKDMLQELVKTLHLQKTFSKTAGRFLAMLRAFF